MRLRQRALVALALVTLCLSTPAKAEPPALHAPLPGSDGVYGRFDGDLTLSAALGAELEASEPRFAVRASAHYLWTAGAYARYSDGFGSNQARAERALSFGVDLRPLFLPRFALDYAKGPALLDLTLDSFALTAGAFLAQPRLGKLGSERGFEAGVGVGVPLLARAGGPWLEARAERRWPDHARAAFVFSLYFSLHALTLTKAPHP